MTRALPLLALLTLVVSGCARTTPVQNPQPLQADPDYRVTQAAIKTAMANRAWVVQEERPGVITALFMKSRYRLLVQITYDQRSVFVSFVGSEGLDQRQDGSVLVAHPSVNRWMVNLQRDIGLVLAQGSIGAPPPGPPPAPAPAPADPGPAPGVPPGY